MYNLITVWLYAEEHVARGDSFTPAAHPPTHSALTHKTVNESAAWTDHYQQGHLQMDCVRDGGSSSSSSSSSSSNSSSYLSSVLFL